MRKHIRYFIVVFIGIISLFLSITSKSGASEKIDIKALFEQRYTTWKKFMNSQGEITILSEPTGVTSKYYEDIIELGIPALPYIIDKMKEDSVLNVAVYKITKKVFSVEEQKNKRIYDSYYELYLTWWNEGYKQTPQQFEKLYNEWRSLDRQKDVKETKIKYYEIKSLGIPAIPEIIKKVESGDSSLIPVISYLSNNEIKETATATECIEWWKTNKDKWALHQNDKSGDK